MRGRQVIPHHICCQPGRHTQGEKRSPLAGRQVGLHPHVLLLGCESPPPILVVRVAATETQGSEPSALELSDPAMVLGGLAPRSPSLEYISGKTRFGSVSQSSTKGAVGLELRWGCRSGRAMPPTVNTVPLGKGQPPSPQNLFIEDVADGELSVWPGLLYSAGRTCSENTLTPSLAVWNSEV